MTNLSLEAESRFELEAVVNYIAKSFKVPAKTALKWLCSSLTYNLVLSDIETQISYLIEQGVLES